MRSLLISDLHLQACRPELSALADSLFDKIAKDCNELYILGDLFEYWIGDDACDQTARDTGRQLSALTSRGVDLYIMHGNRDFLLGEDFVKQTVGGTLIREDSIITRLAGTPTLLLHGDTLCTDDTDYQQFRKMVRNTEWQTGFLSRPVSEREETARMIRETSRERGGKAFSENIADINETTLQQTTREHSVTRLLHGHTHRPALHHHTIDGQSVERFVLGDWHNDHAVVALADDNTCKLYNWNGSTLEPE